MMTGKSCWRATTKSSKPPRTGARPGRDVALATVVETWGSAPRPVGTNLVIDGEGNFQGSVSGGCVEGAVVTEAIDVIAAGKPKMLEFGVADETAWQVGLSCGGTIRVWWRRWSNFCSVIPRGAGAKLANPEIASWFIWSPG